MSAAQCSEDALVVWVGSGIFMGRYGGAGGIAQVPLLRCKLLRYML